MPDFPTWQIGMYGAIALLQLVVFPKAFGRPASVASVEFWGGMQCAMIAGFVTSYPMNWWLIRAGIKERM